METSKKSCVVHRPEHFRRTIIFRIRGKEYIDSKGQVVVIWDVEVFLEGGLDRDPEVFATKLGRQSTTLIESDI